jgi:HEAT repeat protein
MLSREGNSVHTNNDNSSVEELVELPQDSDPLLRVQAGFTLGSMCDEAWAAVPALIEMLHQGDVQDRKLAATTLGQFGPSALKAVPALLEAANDEEKHGENIEARFIPLFLASIRDRKHLEASRRERTIARQAEAAVPRPEAQAPQA